LAPDAGLGADWARSELTRKKEAIRVFQYMLLISV
jgi:hypothetical protein